MRLVFNGHFIAANYRFRISLLAITSADAVFLYSMMFDNINLARLIQNITLLLKVLLIRASFNCRKVLLIRYILFDTLI